MSGKNSSRNAFNIDQSYKECLEKAFIQCPNCSEGSNKAVQFSLMEALKGGALQPISAEHTTSDGKPLENFVTFLPFCPHCMTSCQYGPGIKQDGILDLRELVKLDLSNMSSTAPNEEFAFVGDDSPNSAKNVIAEHEEQQLQSEIPPKPKSTLRSRVATQPEPVQTENTESVKMEFETEDVPVTQGQAGSAGSIKLQGMETV